MYIGNECVREMIVIGRFPRRYKERLAIGRGVYQFQKAMSWDLIQESLPVVTYIVEFDTATCCRFEVQVPRLLFNTSP